MVAPDRSMVDEMKSGLTQNLNFDSLRPLYSYRNPTFPTFGVEVVDHAGLILVG
jgi:hypothetical protein